HWRLVFRTGPHNGNPWRGVHPRVDEAKHSAQSKGGPNQNRLLRSTAKAREMNYYNENDPKTAAWLRELIKANLIAPGEVDERSITDVRPDDLRGFRQCHFFAGIG